MEQVLKKDIKTGMVGASICYRGGRNQQGGEAEKYSSVFQRKGPDVRAAEVLLKPILSL